MRRLPWLEQMKESKLTVLCMADWYIPGFKGGGPIRTIYNLSNILSEELNFFIVTRDRDRGSDAPYHSVEVNGWQKVGTADVYYADPSQFGWRAFKEACQIHKPDIVYLNSFFSPKASVIPLIRLLLSRRLTPKILLAPRGEFSYGALAIKKWRKRAYIFAARLLGVYRDVSWHASTAFEAEDIKKVFPRSRDKIHVAPDPVVGDATAISDISWKQKRSGILKITFISRISPIKNLNGLLKMLFAVKSQVRLDVYGPIEDIEYWEQCQETAKGLPPNIELQYHGPLNPADVSAAFAASDLFAFPTLGENFGHVVFESLCAGTPVLISDRTSWQNIPSGAVTVTPLDASDMWRAHIEEAAGRNAEQQRLVRLASFEYATRHAESQDAYHSNLDMIRNIHNDSDK
jgi:glycosyltransferase involved in cell wall biosynthesis